MAAGRLSARAGRRLRSGANARNRALQPAAEHLPERLRRRALRLRNPDRGINLPTRVKRALGLLAVPGLIGLGYCVGFGRELLLAWVFGTSREIEIFRVAFGLPSILSDSAAISFIAVLIPVLLGGDGTGDGAGSRAAFARACRASVLIGIGICAIGLVTMPLQARLLGPGIVGENRAELVLAGRLCWLMFLGSLLSFPLRAEMSLRGRLWPGAAAPMTRSAAFVVGFALLVVVVGADALTASVAAALSGAVVLAMHLLATGRHGRASIASVVAAPWRGGALLPLLSALTLVLATQFLISGGRMLDRAVASVLPHGTLAAVEYSYAFALTAAALIGTTTNILLAPRIGRALRDDGSLGQPVVTAILAAGAGAAVAGGIVASLAPSIVALVLENGAFGADDTAATATVLRWQAWGVGPGVLTLILTQVLIQSQRNVRLVFAIGFKLAIKAAVLFALLGAGWGLASFGASSLAAEVAALAAMLAMLPGFGISARRRAV